MRLLKEDSKMEQKQMTKAEFQEFRKSRKEVNYRGNNWEWFDKLPFIYLEWGAYGDYYYHYDAESDTIFYTYLSIGD